MPSRVPLVAVVLASLAGTTVPTSVLAQAPAEPPKVLVGDAKREFDANAALLRDFIHYLRINRPDLAAGVGRQLLDKNLTPEAFVDVLERSEEGARFDDALARATRSPQTEEIAGALFRLNEAGRRAVARNPDQIARHIGMLSGNQRGRNLARDRIGAAGEYAMPQLLEALLRKDVDTRAEVTRLFISMGQQSVTPLATALPQLDPASQETVANILGQIGYRTALPYLFEVMSTTPSPNVRGACDQAIQRIGLGTAQADAASLYADLAEGYFDARTELTSFPREEFQLLWEYNPGAGLVMTAIRTEVFHEAMAMRMAERSLALRPQNNQRALSLWLAANFARELDTPAGYVNPAYAADRREAMYYAVAAGAAPSQAVLGRALDRKDARLARRAIEAIAQTASGPALFGAAGAERRALAEALAFPNRRVQYDAALALGAAQPTEAFAGSDRVVPLLASAIRDAGTRYAAVVSDNRELADGFRRALEEAGYTVLPVGAALIDLAGPIAETPGIDVIVSSLPAASTTALIAEVRGAAKLSATPVVAVTDPEDAIELGRRYERDPLVAVRGRGATAGQIATSANQLVETASGGPITEAEAAAYATRSLGALRDLAIASNPVFNVGDASLPLIAVLESGKAEPSLEVAEVLARINQKRAQVAVMDSALGMPEGARVAMLGKVAESAKRFGNLLEPRQVDRALELARTARGAEATAAAALVGSLNLQTIDIVPLILEKR